jgi:hypothetical protein
MDGAVVSSGLSLQETYITTVHEIGHALGLLHTWEYKCASDKQGDRVRDTPAHKGPSYDLPGAWNCFNGRDLPNTCPDDVKGVDPGPDPVFNW